MGHWQDNLESYLQLLTVHRTSTQMDRQSAALREGMECLDMSRYVSICLDPSRELVGDTLSA